MGTDPVEVPKAQVSAASYQWASVNILFRTGPIMLWMLTIVETAIRPLQTLID
jgi:hypothetical protein